nr:MAG TPA: holin protein [Caudoviricetes sp.]
MLETLRSYWSIISTIITVVAVPAIGCLYKKYKQADARQKAVELGVQALLRDRIVQSYYHYEERGWITLHGLENVNAMYKEYHALGGNGTVTSLVNSIRELDVRDDKRPASQE